MGANNHPTVKPQQLQRDEVRFVVIGEDLHEQFTEHSERSVAEAINTILEEHYQMDYDEVAVEHGREDK